MGTPAETAETRGRPRVCVVVPAYQVERFVAATLRSVLAQTLQDWECVVVDDGSRDGTAAAAAEVVGSDPRMRLVRQENTGLSGARNAGTALVPPSAEYVAYLDSDDLWCEDALEVLVAALDADPAAAGAYGYAELLDEHGEPLRPGFHPGRQRDRHRLVGWTVRSVPEMEPVRFSEWLVVGPVWPPAVALHRRSAVEAAREGGGPFDPALRQLEDWDFYLRAARHGHYRPVGRQVAWYRQHAGQMTQRRAEFWHAHDVVRRKTWESPLNSAAQRRDAVRAWRVAHARRLARSGQRLASALAGGRWDEARERTKGVAVLVAQSAANRPPRADPRHVEWAGRDV